MGYKDRILRSLKKETLLKLARAVSERPISPSETRSELTRIIKQTMSVEEIKRRLNKYRVSPRSKILSVLLVSIVAFSSLTTGLAISSSYPKSQNVTIWWSRTYERTDFNQSVILQRAEDSGYLVAAGIVPESGPMITVIKKVDRMGNVQWNLTIGADYPCSPCSVEPTSDHGYIVAVNVFDTSNLAYPWLVKIDSLGKIQWNSTCRDIIYERIATYAQQAPDGGYILSGYSEYSGSYSAWSLKTSANGSFQVWDGFAGGNWLSTFGGQRTSDGGCLMGITWNSSMISVYRLYPTGHLDWMETHDFLSYVEGHSIALTSDGGCIVAGTISLLGYRLLVAKMSASGILWWYKTYEGTGPAVGRSIQQTSDGGYIIAGYIEPSGTGKRDACIAKVDSNGNMQWNQTFGGIGDDEAHSILQISNDEYIVAGITETNDDSRLWLVSLGVSTLPSSLLLATTVLVTSLLVFCCLGVLVKRSMLKTNLSRDDDVEIWKISREAVS